LAHCGIRSRRRNKTRDEIPTDPDDISSDELLLLREIVTIFRGYNFQVQVSVAAGGISGIRHPILDGEHS
jgi:hypothetical protein